MRDIPTDFGGFAPKNYNGAFSGAVPADEAIAQSLNVPCVDMLRTYGVIRFVELLQDCGLSTLNRPASSYGLSVALGGAEVTLLDITRLYAMMSAAYQSKADHEFPLHDKVALYDTFDAMRNVNRPDRLDWKRVNSVQNIAWKTGTSYGSRDAWAIGLTPDYAVGVWVGNADGSSTPDLTGARTAGPVMFDLMNLLPYCEWFDLPEPDDGTEVVVCRHSGHRAGRYCAQTVTRTCSAASVSSPHCPYCHPVHFSLDGKHQIVGRSEATVTKNVFSLPAEIEHYYKLLHPEYTPIPSVKHSYISTVDIHLPMKLLYPENGSVITLPRQMDGSQSFLTCTAAHSDPAVELFWHCDEGFVAVTRDLHSIQLNLQPGTHTITVVDSDGDAVKSSVVIK